MRRLRNMSTKRTIKNLAREQAKKTRCRLYNYKRQFKDYRRALIMCFDMD